MTVSARGNQTQKRRFEIRIRNVIGTDVPFDMMHANQRLPGGIRNRLRRSHTNKKRSHQTRSVGNTDRIHITERLPCLAQRFFNYLIYFFNVFAGCNLRHHTAI